MYDAELARVDALPGHSAHLIGGLQVTAKAANAAGLQRLPACFHEAMAISAQQPKNKRFAFFAAALSPEALKAILEGAEGVRLGLRDSPEADLARTVAMHLWTLIHGGPVLGSVTESRTVAMTCAVGIALTFEHLRRLRVVERVPSDPFSRWALCWALRQLRL